VSTPEGLPPPLRDLTGLWYGTLGESIVAWALADVGKPGPSVFYAFVTGGSSRGGGVYEATVDGALVKTVFPNRAVLTAKRRGDRALDLTFTPAPAESNFAITARRPVPLHGTLARAD